MRKLNDAMSLRAMLVGNPRGLRTRGDIFPVLIGGEDTYKRTYNSRYMSSLVVKSGLRVMAGSDRCTTASLIQHIHPIYFSIAEYAIELGLFILIMFKIYSILQ